MIMTSFIQWDRQLCNFVLLIGIASMGLGIIQNLPSMPLDDQWETIQNWEERHDALETHLERIVSFFFVRKSFFLQFFFCNFFLKQTTVLVQ